VGVSADPYATVQSGGLVPQPADTGTAVIMAPVGINDPAALAGVPTPMDQPTMGSPVGQPVMAGGGEVDKVGMILAVVGLLVVIGMVVVLALMDVG
jgi:hypothetical protein